MKRGNYKAMSVLLKAGLVAIFALMPFVFFGCSELVDEVAQTLAPKGTPPPPPPPNDEGGRGDAGKTISTPLQDGTTLTFSTVAQNVVYAKDGSHTQAVTPTDVQGDTGEIRYESSNPEVATVNETSGKVSFKKPGFTIITATKAATAAYKAHSVSYALAIQDSSAQNSVKAPTFIIPTNLQWGTLVTFTRDSGYAYRIVPPTNLVKIQDSTQKGESEIVAVGAATVALLATRTTDGSVVVSKQVSFGLQKGTTLKFTNPQEKVLYKKGGSYTQAVTSTSVQGDAGAISYKSSDDAIATVDKKTGRVTFKKGGDVTITARKAATNKYKKHSAQYTLTIGDISITFALHGGTLTGGATDTTLIVQKGQSLNDIGIRQKLTYPSINGVTRTLVRFEHNNNKHNEKTAITSDISLSVVWQNSCGATETKHPKDRKTLKELVEKAISKTSRPNLNHIDTSAITDMNNLFYWQTSFNGEVGCWNTTQVKDMNSMFAAAHAFNQDISKWKTSQVENMESMFQHARVFNQDIGGWDTSQVKNMPRMFRDAHVFNQDIGDWDTSQVKNMSYMFYNARAFNQDLSSWKVDNVEHRWSIFLNSGMVNKSKWPARFR